MSKKENRIIVIAVTIAHGVTLSEEFKKDIEKRLSFSTVKGKTTGPGSENLETVDRKSAIDEIQDGGAIETACDGKHITYSTMADLETAINDSPERRAVIYTDANGINQVESVIGRFDSIELLTVFITDRMSVLKEGSELDEEQIRESALSSGKANYNLVLKCKEHPKSYMMCDEIEHALKL